MFFCLYVCLLLLVYLKTTELLIDVSGSTERMSPFSVTDKMLNKHFYLLYCMLEPSNIADEMFQAGQISFHDHDHITDARKKYKRVMNLLDVLNRKQLHASFAVLLESLEYTSLLETLGTDMPYTHILCK